MIFGILLFCASLAVGFTFDDALYSSSRTKCFEELGCFSTGGPFFHPIIRPINALPDEREVNNVRFHLYTRENPTQKDELNWRSTEDDLKKSHFKGGRGSKFMIHGFLDTVFFGKWMSRMKNEFLKEGDYNVFVVDWKGGNSLPYTQACANARLVGAEIALLITKLQKIFGIDPMSCHVLGHSLGGQVAGYVGDSLNKLGRITAFDPAGPYFEGMPKEVRTDPTDADFVEVIHTSAGKFIPKGGLGIYQPSGHVDFYPNGGIDQAGCDLAGRLESLVNEDLLEGIRDAAGCKHVRAVHLYEQSINSKCLPVAYVCPNYELFLQGKCASCGNKGQNCAPLGHKAIEFRPHKDDNRLAQFFLVTGRRTPYCIPQYSFTLKMSSKSGAKSAKGYFKAEVVGENGAVEVKLNEKKQELHPGGIYTFLSTSEKDIGEIKGINFRFEAFGFFFNPGMYLDYLEVFPMNTLTNSETRSKVLKRFCHDGFLKHRSKVSLKKC